MDSRAELNDSLADAGSVIVEDPEIQGGASTFRGTRILVHQIAALLAQGVGPDALREDYPRLTPAMIAAAASYVQAHALRAAPRVPPWRTKTGADSVN